VLQPSAPTPSAVAPRPWARFRAFAPLLAALPPAILSLSLLVGLRNEAGEQSRAELSRAALGIAAVLDTRLEAETRALEALAASPAAAAGDLEAFREEARRLLAQQPAWHNIVLLDADRQLLNLRMPPGVALPPASVLPAAAVLQTGRSSAAAMPDGGLALRVPVRLEGALRYALVAVLPPLSLGLALERAGLPQGSAALLVEDGRVLARAGSAEVPEAALRPALSAPGHIVQADRDWLAAARVLSGASWQVAVAMPVGDGLALTELLLAGALALSALIALAALVLQRRTDAEAPAMPGRPATSSTAGLLAEFAAALRAPLGTLCAAQEALTRGLLPPDAARLVASARASAEAARTVAADMLDVARLEAGAIAVEDADTDLPSTLEECAALMRDGGGRVTLAADPGLPRWVRSDPRRLRRLVSAMLKEAAGVDGAGEVTLSARLSPRPGGGIEIAVTGGRPRGGEFRGGGPVFCRVLAAALGGSLAEAEGERVVLTLPFRPGAAPAPHGTGLRMLVAEDVPAARLLLAAVLERGGHQVEAVGDGVQALAAMHRGGFDMLLVDLHMPGMDGYGVAAAVRSIPGEAGRLPMLALTADPPETVERRCREAGFDAVMRKPFETRRLLGLIEALRGRSDAVGREPLRAVAG
jgi:CheY-like chemotaxis protein/signal transduction histidine kinase